MVTTLFQPFPKWRVFDDDGVPAIGFKLFTFVAGTVDTPKATFKDLEGLVPNTNPIIFDTRGEADIRFATDGLYKVELFSAKDVLQFSVDNYGTDTGTASMNSPNRAGGEKTVRLTANSGDVLLSGTGADSPLGIYPVGSLPYGLLLFVETSLGNGQGLTGLIVGTSVVTDAYGRGISRLAGTTTTPTDYTNYSPAPVLVAADAVIRAEGGAFDGTGSLLATVFFETQTAVITLP